MKLAMLASVLPALLLATEARAQEPREKTFAQTCPQLTKAELEELDRADKDGRTFRGLIWYARENCVPLAESKRRMDIQNRDAVGAETEPGGPASPPPDSIGSISQKVETNEAATFAGLWIQHQPEYRVVVAFTRDAARTLRKYTTDPLFKPLNRRGPTQAELRETQGRMVDQLQRFGARPASASADIMRGRVEVEVLGDLTAFKAAVARGEAQLPAYVDIREPKPLERTAPPLPPSMQNPVKAFPRVAYRSGGMELSILRTGKLVLQDGCLRLLREHNSPVVVWNNEAALDLVSKPGQVRIIDRRSGVSITTDETVTLGGNSGPLADSIAVLDSSPACPGPYYHVAGFGRYERIEEGQIQGRANELAQSLKLSKAEALSRARAEHAREKRFGELAGTLLGAAPESFAGISTYQGRATVKFSRNPQGEAKRLIPSDLQPFITAEIAPRPLAELRAEKSLVLDQLEARGITASANEDVDAGRVTLQVEDLAALSKAAVAGIVRIPASVQIATNGAQPAGTYSDGNMQAANRALEAAPDFAEIRALVEATLLPSRLVTYDEGQPDRPPTRAQSLDITRFMVALGFTARDIRALKAHGIDPVRAWVQQNGMSTPENRAMLVPAVVVGELLDVTNELLGDGFRSTARFRVVEALSGGAAAGEEVLVRLVSGNDSDGKLQQSNEEPIRLPGLPGALSPGTRWLMFLSEGMLAHQARNVGGRASATRAFVAMYGFWPVKGDRIGRNYMEAAPGNLSDLRRRLAPVDRGFDAANAEVGGNLLKRRLP